MHVIRTNPESKDSKEYIKVRIDAADAANQAPRTKPFEIEGYKIYADGNYLYIVKGKQIRHLLEDGELIFVKGPFPTYFYFRSDKFQDLLDKYNMTRVIHKEPEVAIPARFFVKRDIFDAYQVVTDGAVEIIPYEGNDKQTVRNNGDDVNILTFSIRNPTDYVVITNATYAMFQQVAIKYDQKDKANRVVYQSRQLVTKRNSFEMPDVLAVAANILDKSVADLLKVQISTDSASDAISKYAITYVDMAEAEQD